MPKHRASFNVSITTEDKVGARVLAKLIRLSLGGLKVWQGLACNRKAVGVVKVTVTNVGEK